MVSPGWRHRIGEAAEQHAARLLTDAGFQILERRYRRPGGEIDLVAADATYLLFVEVKARRHAAFGSPAEAVGAKKRQRLARVARHYLREHGRRGRAVRFDVIAFTGDGAGRLRAEWIQDAFRV